MDIVNHKKLPFFDNLPERGKSIFSVYAGYAAERPWLETKSLYKTLIIDLERAGVDRPSYGEFADWFNRIRETKKAPGQSEVVRRFTANSQKRKRNKRSCRSEENGSTTINCAVEPKPDATDVEELTHAVHIVRAYHSLAEAKLAAGYSPPSCGTDDTIVADAIKTVISSRPWPIWRLSPAGGAVNLLLSQCDDDIDGTVLDVLSMDLQRELCAALVNGMAEESGAA